jgi:hypothetical protein
MAHRATAFSKKNKAEPPVFASVSAADIIRAPVVHRTIPLDLLPLIKPLKRAGRLMLRIERMPQRAKLSAGQRNNDNSWSLASDELEGLNYLVPSNLSAEHELTIRVMRFDDGAASTLKVAQFPIPRWDGTDAAEAPAAHQLPEDEAPLRSQLGEMQSLFAVRESELGELRAALACAHDEKTAELAKARAAWEEELSQRLSQAAETGRKQARDVKDAEQDRQKSAHAEAEKKITAERERWEAEAARHIAAERRRLEALADQRVETERHNGQAEAEQRLKTERERWQAEADQQFDAEHRRWEALSEQRLEGERRNWQAEAERRLEAEHARWGAQSEQRLETESRNWQAEVERRLEAERARWDSQGLSSLKEAEERWKGEEARRLTEAVAAARAEWRQESDREETNTRGRLEATLAEEMKTRARLETSLAEEAKTRGRLETALTEALAAAKDVPAPRDPSELDALRNDLAAAKRSLAERELDNARHRTELEQERDRARRDGEASQAQAASGWKKEEAARLEAALNAAKAQSDAALAAALSRLQEAERALERVQAEAKNQPPSAALAKAKAQSDEALAAAMARLQEAERALERVQAEARSQAPAPGRSHDDAYVERLRSDITRLEASLASREVELGRLRATLDQAPAQRAVSRPMRDSYRGEEPGRVISKTLVRDFAVAFVLIAALMLFYPTYSVFLPQGLKSGIDTAGALSAPAAPRSVIVPAPAPAAAQEAVHAMTIVNRTVNVRAMPSSKSDTVVILPRSSKVAVLQQQGSWTLIEIPGETASGKIQQGWVFNTYLGEKKAEARSNRDTAAAASEKSSPSEAPDTSAGEPPAP